jgi:hypothetical protein
MNLIKEINKMDRKVILSTLWIFAVLNYIYADVFTSFFNPIFQPEETKEFLSGQVGSIQITQEFVLFFAIIMETAIAMVLLSRILKYSLNRWTNIIVAIIHTASVAWSMTEGALNFYYVFFALIEIATTLFIIWYAWTWPKPKPSLIKKILK